MAAMALLCYQEFSFFKHLQLSIYLSCSKSLARNQKPKMTDNTQKMSFQAGEAKGQAQEKASNLVEKAGNAAQTAKESVLGEKTSPTLMEKAGTAAQYAKESVQGAGQQVMSTAQGAVEGVKNATGMNK